MKSQGHFNPFKVLFFAFILFGISITAQSQVDIFQLMERNDLKIDEVEKIANTYFDQVGTGKGTGFKQYSRWLYERKFHLNDDGYYISPEVENKQYQKFVVEHKKYKASNVTWSELGPQSWTYTSGWNPGVGRVTSVAIHPADTTKIYVSSPGGGIWKSTNGGSTWTPLMDNTSNAWMNVFNLCIDPSNQNTIYAAASSSGVIKSTNAGITWASTGSGPSSPKKVLVHPSNSNIVFATGSNGIWRSVNAGSAWTQVSSTSVEDIEFNPFNVNIMYASGSGVWRSSNNGVSWTSIGSGGGITASGRTLLGVSPNNPAVVYAVQASGSLFGKMYKSTDSGMTYTTLITGSPSAGTNFFGYEPNGTGTTGQATYDMAICVNPNNVNEVHIAGIICWKSTNGGSNFTAETVWSYPNSTGYNHADVHALEWVNGTIYSGSDGGIYKSVNKGNDWIDLSAGLGIRQFYRISCSKTDPNVITSGAQDNGSSFRRSNGSWVDWLGADGMDNAISPTNAAIAIGTSQYGSIYKTTNSGASRTNLTKPANGNWVTPLVMHPTNHDTIYGGWTGIWRSSNGGTSWTNISSGAITGMLTTLAVSSSNTKYIYGSIGTTLYRTSNGGTNWTSVTAPASITSIFVSQSDPAKIWITCNSSSARVYVSTNMGSSFTDLSSGLPSMAARSIVVENNSNEGTYVGMNVGVYYRDNNNPNWQQHGSGLPLVAINEVEIQESGGKLRVATYGRGVWESGLQSVTTCATPTSLNSSNISSNSAQINWASASGGVNYTIEYKASASSTWIGTTNTSGTSATLTGLSSGTAYDWQVRTNCATGNSNYVLASFTTSSPCTNPSGLSATGVTASGATLNWSAVSGALSYTVENKLASSSTWGGTTVTTGTSIGLTGLNPLTAYDWRVMTNCTLDSSQFSQSSFTTLSNCTAPSNPLASNLTSNSATVSWTASGGAISYNVEYKLATSGTWITLSPTTNTYYNLTGLSAGVYNWRVYSNCNSSSSSYLVSSFGLYCSSSGASTSSEYIDLVKLGTINRTSGSDGGYYNGTAISTNLKPGTSYTITVSPFINGSRRTQYFRVFIDYNGNGVFTDAGEQVAQKSTKSSKNTSLTFTVPSTATLGTTRMRVSMKYGSYASSCENFANGEVEDYSVVIENTPSFNPDIVMEETSTELKVFPVPTDYILNYSFVTENLDNEIITTVKDISGRELYRNSSVHQPGVVNAQIDVSNLKNGLYFLEIKNGSFNQVKKFLISK